MRESPMPDDDAVTIEINDRLVTALRNGRVLWQTDAVAAAPGPIAGEPRVRSATIHGEEVHAVVGKHSLVILDLRTGSVLETASD
ncbi:MAG: hypothetical protein AMXMBFR20_00870 [Planctomycetia bacterium]